MIVTIILILIIGITWKINDTKNNKFQLELVRIRNLDQDRKQLELIKLTSKMNDMKTNHILHLLLSCFTLSLWVIPWLIISRSNKSQRDELQKLIDSI